MALAKIKNEFATKKIAFGKSAAALSERNDIDDLAILAHESQDKSLLRLFEFLPELSVLKKAKTEGELKRNVVVVAESKEESAPRKRRAKRQTQ